MFKELTRTLYWVCLFIKTGSLKHISKIAEIGPGNSDRIPKLLSLFSYQGKYFSVDHSLISPPKDSHSSFKTESFQKDFFDFQTPVDLLIFDHSVDDILAAGFEKHPNQKDYPALMDNLKLFDYQNTQFIGQIKQILIHSKTLISPGGKIIISNYVTKYDHQRNTVEIMNQLLPQLSVIAKQLGLETEYCSKHFLVLKSFH
jgi:hypothetical protein